MALTAQARELTFWIGDQKITPGSTLESNKYELIGGLMLQMDPQLYISSDIYTSKATITANCTSGQSIQMCCKGSCESGKTVTKEGVKIQTNEKLPLEFEYFEQTPFSGELPTIVTEFTAQDGTYENTRISFILYMGKEGCYAKAVEADNPIMLVPGGIAYNLPEGGTVELFSITGSSVLKAAVHGIGLLDTSSLGRGVYVYSVSAPSLSRTGKVVVK